VIHPFELEIVLLRFPQPRLARHALEESDAVSAEFVDFLFVLCVCGVFFFFLESMVDLFLCARVAS